MQLKITDRDYYSKEDKIPYISQSSIKDLDPENNGHPSKFHATLFDPIVGKKSRSLENGGLLHDWIEHNSTFAIANINKPEEKVGEIADKIVEILKTDSTLIHPGDDILFELFKDIRWNSIPYYNNRTDDKSVWETFKKSTNNTDPLKYIHFAFDNKDKVILTQDQEITLTACHDSLRKHEIARQYLFETGFGREIKKELETYWTENWDVKDKTIVLYFKARKDRVIIDHEKKQIIIVELKTHGKGSAYNYAPRSLSLIEHGKKTPFQYYYIDQQFSFYKRALVERPEIYELISQGYEFKYKIVVVETTDKFNTYTFDINFMWITKAQGNVHKLLDRAAFHLSTDKWDRQMEEYTQGLEIGTYYA